MSLVGYKLIRFVCAPTGVGIFQETYERRDSDEVADHDREELAALLRWFEPNLPTPDRFVRTTSKGHYRREPVAISWFRDDAEECITRVWRVVRCLERIGVTVEMVRTSRPGYVTCEDQFQVVALPFSDAAE